MSAAHTPGPWVFDGEPHNIVVWSGPHDRVCFLTSDGPNEANARLIAAAPDLLEAAKTVLAGLNHRIENACSSDGQTVPVFAGIAALHDAIARTTAAA